MPPHIREMKPEGEHEVSTLLAEVFDDKRGAILGEAEGWLDVVTALLQDFTGPIIVIEKDSKIAGAAALRLDHLWEPGKRTSRAVVSSVGILGGLRAKKRLDRLLSTLPEMLGDEGMVDALGIAQDFRKSGLGSRILTECEERSRAAGKARVCLSVKADNAPALALYRKHGFEVASEYTNAWGHNLYMKKRL